MQANNTTRKTSTLLSNWRKVRQRPNAAPYNMMPQSKKISFDLAFNAPSNFGKITT